MEQDFVEGDIVVSTNGHDKDRPFVIVSIDKNRYPVIIDGRYRIKSKPKNKNPKHLKKVAHDDEILHKINSPIVTDAEIYKLIKAHFKVKE